MKNYKLGITMYTIAFIFAIFCFLMVGCSTDDCDETVPTNGEYKSENCVVEFTQDTTETVEEKDE